MWGPLYTMSCFGWKSRHSCISGGDRGDPGQKIHVGFIWRISMRGMLFTECQNKFSFKSYARLKFCILVAILINFGQKLRFLDISLKLYLVSPFWSKLAEIWTRSSLNNFEENQGSLFESFDFFWFYADFSQINGKFCHFSC